MNKLNNVLPNSVNIGFIALIVILLLVGCYPFLSSDYDPESSIIANLYSLIPFVISSFTYLLILFATTLFSYDLVTIMTIAFLFGGFGCFVISVFLKDVTNKTNLFSVGSAMLGLGGGMPIGKALSLAKKNK